MITYYTEIPFDFECNVSLVVLHKYLLISYFNRTAMRGSSNYFKQVVISYAETNCVLFWCVLNCILSCFYSNMCEIRVWNCIECDVTVLDEINVVEGL